MVEKTFSATGEDVKASAEAAWRRLRGVRRWCVPFRCEVVLPYSVCPSLRATGRCVCRDHAVEGAR